MHFTSIRIWKMLPTNLIRYRAVIISALLAALVWIIAGKLAWMQLASWIFIVIAALASLLTCMAVQVFAANRQKKSIDIDGKKFVLRFSVLAAGSIILFVLFYTTWVFTFEQLSLSFDEKGDPVRDIKIEKLIRGPYYSDSAKTVIRTNALPASQPAEVLKEMGGLAAIHSVWSSFSIFLSSLIVLLLLAIAISSIVAVIEFFIETFLANNIVRFLDAQNTEGGGPPKTVFISYSRKDKSFVQQMAKDLQQRGISVWVDVWDIKAGMGWTNAIEMAIDKSDTFLLIVTPDSVKSTVVEKEITRAFDKKKRSIPVIYKPAELPLLVNNNNAIFYQEPYENFVAQLAKEIKDNG